MTVSKDVKEIKLHGVSAAMETGRKGGRQTAALFLTTSDSEVLNVFSVNSDQI